MNPSAVADATPLIVLARVGRLDLLGRVFSRVLVPPLVWSEVAGAPGRPGAAELRAAPWAQRTRVRSTALLRELRAELGAEAGEAEAVALARQRGLRVLLDDDAAVRAARPRGLRVIRLPYLLYVAHSHGLLRTSLRTVFDEAQTAGFHLPSEVRIDLLRRSGELD